MDTNLTSLLFRSGTDYLSLLFLWISLVHPLLEMCFCIIIIIKVSFYQTIIVIKLSSLIIVVAGDKTNMV